MRLLWPDHLPKPGFTLHFELGTKRAGWQVASVIRVEFLALGSLPRGKLPKGSNKLQWSVESGKQPRPQGCLLVCNA